MVCGLIKFCFWPSTATNPSYYGSFFSYSISNSFLLQGLAYQLIDDVLDFTGTSASLGKGSLTDIRLVIYLSLISQWLEILLVVSLNWL